MISSRYQNNSLPTLDLNAVQLEKKLQIETKILSKQYLFEDINCAICDGNSFCKLADKDRYGLYCPNVVCRDCGLVMINPRMTEKSYNEFYNEEYRDLYSGIHSNAENFFHNQNLRGKRLYDYLDAKELILIDPTSPPFMLEVGCGAGGILNYFRNKGFNVRGIDLGEEYLKYGCEKHELDLEVGSLKDITMLKKPNFIVYSHVMEHILDVNEELELIKHICSDNTLVYVEVPSIKNIASGYRNDPLRYFQNAHTYSFSLTSLKNLFIKHNFQFIYGSERVRAVFQLRNSSIGERIENDYQKVVKGLCKSDLMRKYYFISVMRLKIVVWAIFQRLKNYYLKN